MEPGPEEMQPKADADHFQHPAQSKLLLFVHAAAHDEALCALELAAAECCATVHPRCAHMLHDLSLLSCKAGVTDQVPQLDAFDHLAWLSACCMQKDCQLVVHTQGSSGARKTCYTLCFCRVCHTGHHRSFKHGFKSRVCSSHLRADVMTLQV